MTKLERSYVYICKVVVAAAALGYCCVYLSVHLFGDLCNAMLYFNMMHVVKESESAEMESVLVS